MSLARILQVNFRLGTVARPQVAAGDGPMKAMLRHPEHSEGSRSVRPRDRSTRCGLRLNTPDCARSPVAGSPTFPRQSPESARREGSGRGRPRLKLLHASFDKLSYSPTIGLDGHSNQ